MNYKSSNNKVIISFIGDVLPANMPYTIGNGNYEVINRLKFFPKNKTSNIFFANLEAPITKTSNSLTPFSGNSLIVPLLLNAGINIVNIANNHILELGKNGFYETISLLRENNIKVVGINDNGTSNIEKFIFGKNVITFVGFNDIHDIKNTGLYAELSREALLLAIERLKLESATIKILSVHWGNEYYELPNKRQIEIANYAINLGFDLIIGHHSHVIQKIDRINGKYIFYSLGNAFFDFLFSANVRKGLRVDAVIKDDKIYYDISQINAEKFGFEKLNNISDELFISETERAKINHDKYETWYKTKIYYIRLYNRYKMKIYWFKRLMTSPVKQKIFLVSTLYKSIKNKF